MLSLSDSLTMGKLHKDIAMFLVQCADDSEKTQQQVIKVSQGHGIDVSETQRKIKSYFHFSYFCQDYHLFVHIEVEWLNTIFHQSTKVTLKVYLTKMSPLKFFYFV